MRALLLDDARAAEWEALLACEDVFALLHLREWAAFKERLGWRAHLVAVDDEGELVAGALLLIKPLPFGLSLAYVPRGPVGDWLYGPAGPVLLAELERLSRAEGAIFLKLEPPVTASPRLFRLLSDRGYHSSRLTNQPRTTLVIDITGSPNEVLRRMHKRTRGYARHADREGITVRFGTGDDIPAFSQLMHATAARAGFAPRDQEYYQAEWDAFSASDRYALLLAYHEERLIAARTVHRCLRHAAEFHGGSVTIPGLHPNQLLAWHGIQWAREHGCETYDMWGVPDEVEPGPDGKPPAAPDRRDGLWGVYRFKRSFGGQLVRYAGAYDLALKPRLYSLTDAALVNRQTWESAAAWLDRPARQSTPTGVCS